MARKATIAAPLTDDVTEAAPVEFTLPSILATDGSRHYASAMGGICQSLAECQAGDNRQGTHLTPDGRNAIPALIEGLWLLSEGRATLVIADPVPVESLEIEA